MDTSCRRRDSKATALAFVLVRQDKDEGTHEVRPYTTVFILVSSPILRGSKATALALVVDEERRWK